MCLFCGGTCGGSGDAFMPLLAVGAGIVILKVRAYRSARKTNNDDRSDEQGADTESASKRGKVDSRQRGLHQ